MQHRFPPTRFVVLLTLLAVAPAIAAPNPAAPQKSSNKTLSAQLLGSIVGSSGPSLPGAVIPPGETFTETHKGGILAGDGGPVADGLQLFLRPQKPTFSAEEPVMVDMELRNGRKTDLSFEDFGSALRSVSVTIKDEQGQEVPLTAFGKHLYGKQPFLLGQDVFVPAAMRATYHFWLNRAFDTSLPGTYAVTIRKTIDNDARNGRTEVVSNTASLTVLEPAYQSPYSSGAGPDQPPHQAPPPATGDFTLKF